MEIIRKMGIGGCEMPPPPIFNNFSSDCVSPDVVFEALGDYGGPTQVHRLYVSRLVIGIGTDFGCAALAPTRGLPCNWWVAEKDTREMYSTSRVSFEGRGAP